MNVFDYLKWRGDIPLSVSPFNEVDNLILAELAYADFGGIVPENGTAVPLETVHAEYFRRHSREAILSSGSCTARAPLLMDEMCRGTRFADTRLAFYRSESNTEADMQFGAVTFLLSDGTAYAAFRGTDGTLVGWKEDFNLSYLSGTEGQQKAAEYLSAAGKALDCPLRIGGHSKGGNLAVYAAASCDETVQRRITAVYSNDGPGFRPEFVEGEGYRRILPRVISIVPESSVIGMLMESLTEPKVIRSAASGMLQHDGFTWETERDRFAPGELSETSRLVSRTLAGWLERTDDESRKAITETVFSLLEATGEDTFSGIRGSGLKSVGAMAQSVRKLPKGSMQELGRLMTRLGQSGVRTATSFIQSIAAEKLQGHTDAGQKKPEESGEDNQD